jgi:hypothetical protein
VYFIRGKEHYGSATAFSAIIDEKRISKLNYRKYSVHEVTSGPHDFKAQFKGKKGKQKAEVARIDIEAGGKYYIQMVMESSYLSNDLIAQEITRNSALHLIEDDKIEPDPNSG